MSARQRIERADPPDHPPDGEAVGPSREMEVETSRNGQEKARGRDPETGRFTQGWKGGGRPRGARDRVRALILAMEREARKQGAASLEDLLAERALDPAGDPRLLARLLRSLFPPGSWADDDDVGRSVVYAVEVVDGVFSTRRIVEEEPSHDS